MSRSGYSDDCENLGLWRGAVSKAIHGKRGQAFLREMASAMDAMPAKELITDDIVTEKGEACAIGTVALARGTNLAGLDVTDQRAVANAFGVAHALAAEIAFENDECGTRFGAAPETPADRWKRMREWVASQIRDTTRLDEGDGT